MKGNGTLQGRFYGTQSVKKAYKIDVCKLKGIILSSIGKFEKQKRLKQEEQKERGIKKTKRKE